MSTSEIPHPKIVSQDEWLAQRKALLANEKELTKHKDAVNAERRRLPMVKVDKEYTFEGPEGKKTLLDLFDGCRQLIIYHFMYDPEWEKGCGGCTYFVDALGKTSELGDRDTRFVLVSRAPLAKLEAYKSVRGWNVPWYSSYGSDFNYDFHATLDKNVAPVEYNYKSEAEMKEKYGSSPEGEEHGISVFFRLGEDIYHTYSVFARGTESITDFYSLLDITPYGRQEDFEDSPAGWPQKPIYG